MEGCEGELKKSICWQVLVAEDLEAVVLRVTGVLVESTAVFEFGGRIEDGADKVAGLGRESSSSSRD